MKKTDWIKKLKKQIAKLHKDMGKLSCKNLEIISKTLETEGDPNDKPGKPGGG